MIFSFLQGSMCVPEKSGTSQKFYVPDRAQSASGAQFVQACFLVAYQVDWSHGLLSENESGVYSWVDNRFITVTNGVVKSLKYQTIIDWSYAIGMTSCS